MSRGHKLLDMDEYAAGEAGQLRRQVCATAVWLR